MIQNLLARLREFVGIHDETDAWHDPAELRLRPWLLPLLSATLGLLLGLFIGWVLWPVEWQNIRPSHLDADARAQYIGAVADAYVAQGETEEAAAVAAHRLKGMEVDDYGLAFTYFDNELADFPYVQTDQNIRRDNLNRLAYRLVIDPAEARQAVDSSVFALNDGALAGDATTGNGQADSGKADSVQVDLLPGDGQVDVAAQASEGGFSLGHWFQLGLICLAAIAMILGGMYLIRYWLEQRHATGEVEGSSSADSIGPYRDKAKRGSGNQAADEPLDDDEEFDDYYDPDEDDRIRSYEPQAELQSGIDEINPNLYQPSPQQAISPFEPESRMAQSAAYMPSAGSATPADRTAFQRPATTPQPTSVSAQPPAQPRQNPATQHPAQSSAQQSSAQPRQNLAAQPSVASKAIPQTTQQAMPSARSEHVISGAPRTGEVIAQFTARYQRGSQQYEQQRNIVAPADMNRGSADGLLIGEYGMGTNMKSGVLQNDPENVIALDVWLFDKTDQNGPRNQTRVLISEHVVDHDLSDTIMRDVESNMPPIVPRRDIEFEIRGTSLLLICKVIEAGYVKGGEMKGVFESVAVDMTVMYL